MLRCIDRSKMASIGKFSSSGLVWFGLLAGLLGMPIATSHAASDIEPAIPSDEVAPIALMVDLTSGQTLYSREADRRFVPASITKAMTTFLAFEKMEAGELNLQQVFTVGDEAYRNWRRKGSTMFLNRGDRITVDQLLHGVTTVSANDGSVVLGEGASGSLDAWLDEMNALARRIGMKDSHFGSPNGYPDDGRTWTTANDLATLAEAMIRRHPSKFDHFVGHAEFEYNGIKQPNHDPLIGKLRGADGIKTGFTYQAGYGFLGTAERDGRRLAMVVAGSDSGRERNRAAQAFMEWGFSAFDRMVLYSKDERVGSAQVQDGSWPSIDLVAPHMIALSVPANTRPEVAIRITYEGPVRAPIRQGERIATLHVEAEGMPDASIPLLAARDIEKAGPFQRMLNGIVGWFR